MVKQFLIRVTRFKVVAVFMCRDRSGILQEVQHKTLLLGLLSLCLV